MFTPKDVGQMFSENVEYGTNPYAFGEIGWEEGSPTGAGAYSSGEVGPMDFFRFMPYVGQLLSMWSAHRTNQREMRFAERMSNTSWQRGIADMRRAGINPMVAFSSGGASSPSVQLESPGAGFGELAASVQQLAQQNRLISAQVEQLTAAAGYSKVLGDAAGAQAGRESELFDIMGKPKAERWQELFQAELNDLRQRADTGASQQALNTVEFELKEMAKAGAEYSARNFQMLSDAIDSLPGWMQPGVRALVWVAGQAFAPALFGAMIKSGKGGTVKQSAPKLPDGLTGIFRKGSPGNP